MRRDKSHIEEDAKKRKFSKNWDNIFNHVGREDYQLILDQLNFLDDRGAFPDSIVTLLKLDEVKALYVSSSVQRILGYTQEEYLDRDLFFNRGGTDKQRGLELEILRSIDDFNRIQSGKPATNVKYRCCGVMIKHKDGSHKQTLFKYTLKKLNDDSLPQVDIGIRYDVTELLKGEKYWIYREKTVDNNVFSKLYTKDKDESYLISPREKDVLRLIASGMSSKEVAQALHISVETVRQHRKNMLQRTYAKDTSALIQLCKLCEIL